ncbi:MAG: thiamine phosphate synthase [Clostridia bacterium]|nr:thiamine phosphate synthase [Clostridia bacterium]
MKTSRHTRLICVTDRLSLPGGGEDAFLERMREIADSRVDAIILRERDLDPQEYRALAEKVMRICRQYGMPCILHKYVQQAKDLGAEYIHMSVPHLKETPGQDLQGFRALGVSCHSTYEAEYAQSRGAAYILAGHVYETHCKLGSPGRGLTYLRDICSCVEIPVYAIGGISPEKVPEVLSCGAAGICSMSGFMKTADIPGYIRDMTVLPPLKRAYLKLYAITDTVIRPVAEECERVRAAILGGATMIQLRKKTADQALLEEYARAVSRVCREYGVPCIINDNVPAAMKYADGVHLGAADAAVQDVRGKAPRGFIIGATAKTIRQALQAESAGADYIGAGAMFPSGTKENAVQITRGDLDEICDSVHIPAVCIGGISKGNMPLLRGCRAAGAAVVQGIFGAEDIQGAARDLRALAEETFI